jgi:hypothetical protein
MIPTLFLALGLLPVQEDEKVGARPYELDGAGRNEETPPPLIDFEDLTGWKASGQDAEARVSRTRERQIWGKHVGRVVYRATGLAPVVRVAPPAPVRIDKPFDTVTCWIHGNNWGYASNPETPPVEVTALFKDSKGGNLHVRLAHVDWEEWFLCHRRLSPAETSRVAGGAAFEGFEIRDGRNKADRAIYFDNLAVFVEELKPLTFLPRPERGIPMFPGQGAGTNIGPGRLPFPTRPETILPDNLTDKFTTRLEGAGDAFIFTYDGQDGRLTWRLEPKTGTLGDLSVRWEGRGGIIRPCAGGGVFLRDGGSPKFEHASTRRGGDEVRSRWKFDSGEVTYTYRLWKKSLVVDVAAPGGRVAEVRYGRAEGVENPRLVTLPFYVYGGSRPAVVAAGPPETPLFLACHTDWCLSNGSIPWAVNRIDADGVACNGGLRYVAKTDGKLNDCFERLFLTLSPRFEEVLPDVPNPVSPWKHVTGTRVWRAHGAGNREHDVRFWTECRRYGMTEVVVTDHETMWRDGGESFTFRTRTAPKKGGDPAQVEYSRVMQDRLGFVYGPYNNFTDFAPVNEYWSPDLVSRTPENQFAGAWFRCYAPKPARAVEYCALLAPKIQEKFRFSTAYCDVHTAVAPWDRVDYDARVPGAGTFAATFYSFGEIMLLQKAAWKGPVYSEGNSHFPYCGLTDGNYAQDQRYRPAVRPWLVDFDLRKLHDLCCNFGMGNLEMFYGDGCEQPLDRFLAATVAFGHTGFLVYEGGIDNALRSYYLLQQLHSRYALSSARDIRYADAAGRLLDSSAAVATGAYERSQVVTRYKDGCLTAANGHASERMKVDAFGRRIDLPPDGFAGWTEDGAIEVLSGDRIGLRTGYADTPAYIFVDGRGRFARHPKAASAGIGICRKLSGGGHEVIPVHGSECGFAVRAAGAAALDREGKETGPAELRVSRGLTYVMPVKGAFSYVLRPGESLAGAALWCDRDEAVPGERLVVKGREEHAFEVPRDAKAGTRLWKTFDGSWIDFTVVPTAEAEVALDGDVLKVGLTSRLPGADEFEIEAAGRKKSARLEPGVRVEAELDLGPPREEGESVLEIRIAARGTALSIERGLRVAEERKPLAAMPEKWRAGMALRGRKEQYDFGDTGGHVNPQAMRCGGEERRGLFMHPPWQGGVGYSFALYDSVKVPTGFPAAFRAWVGKQDGSHPGDGILFKVVVVEEGREIPVAETVVTKHEWIPLEADLSRWRGKSVQIRIVSDVGAKDDSGGDWACWAGMRIESRDAVLSRSLDHDVERYRTEPGPFPIKGLPIEELRKARRGWLMYDGMGMSGGQETHASEASLNGVDLGRVAGAAGDEARGTWAEKVGMPLPAEAIAKLGRFNTVLLRNPRQDSFKARRFWIELELADGRKCSSDVATAVYTQPPGWAHAEGIRVPSGVNIRVGVSFRP